MNHNNQDDSLDSLSDIEDEKLELEALELTSTLRRVEYYQHFEKMPCYTEQSELLTCDRHVSVIEAVSMCFYILSHVAVIRVVVERFQRSKDTVYRQFKRVLKGLCGLAPRIIHQQTRGQQPPPPVIRRSPKFYLYFKATPIPIACCVLHNFIRSQARGDMMFMEYDNEDMLFDDEGEGRAIPNIDLTPSNVALMSNVRDEIVRKMWRDNSHNRR
ncbi:hypothetical protein Dsin_028291 [Dipteronia sinensis]|uniref:DUF8040 domain-containing protein n=1 Tax=Dipteronia sinensis TaxID=43782 RepID=A0AAD9ZQA9_9ROSI|nr:hypothetical protein Dsin_028291 [Dipteronia sinensis]